MKKDPGDSAECQDLGWRQKDWALISALLGILEKTWISFPRAKTRMLKLVYFIEP